MSSLMRSVRWPVARRHYFAFGIFAALFGIWFLLARFPKGSNALGVCGAISVVGLPILFYLWCKSDASHRGVSPPPGAIPLGAVLWPVAWIYYVLATRNIAKGVGTVLLITLAAVAVVVAGALLGHAARTWAT